MARGDEQLNRIFEQGLAGSSAEERKLMAIREGLKSLKADVSCPVEFDDVMRRVRDVMRRVRTESAALPAATKGGFRLPWMWGGTMAVAATVVAFAVFMSRPQTAVSPTLAVDTPTTAPLTAPLAAPDAMRLQRRKVRPRPWPTSPWPSAQRNWIARPRSRTIRWPR